jgi:hypothetical protein
MNQEVIRQVFSTETTAGERKEVMTELKEIATYAEYLVTLPETAESQRIKSESFKKQRGQV